MSRRVEIENRLIARLSPERLSLEDESHRHNVPEGAESHFNAIIVSEAFGGLSLVKRHRAVYSALGDELRTGLHAFTMKTLTPEEWEAKGGDVKNPAPPCLGGGKKAPPSPTLQDSD